jgi:hypothetical protein
VFTANFIYDLPFFRAAHSRAARTLGGGWQLAGYITAETGLPLNIYLGGPAAYNGLPNYNGNGPGGNRPNVNGTPTYPHTVNQWFGTSIFSAPAPGQWGNLSFDAIDGPGRHNWNLSIFKSFALSEKRGSKLELRAESFNVWNHTQFQGSNTGGISNNFSASNFGQITSAFDPRVFQLGMKMMF